MIHDALIHLIKELKPPKVGIFFARFLGKCKQVFVRDFELDDFLGELEKKFTWVKHSLKELDNFLAELDWDWRFTRVQ